MSLKVIFLMSLFFCTNMFGQKVDSSNNTINRNGFSININYVYNLCSNKKSNTWIIPSGKIANDNTGDSVYYMTFRNLDTKTFGINVFYNKTITQKLSFSIGVGFIQRKQTTKYDVYIDSNLNKPNKLFDKYTSNSIIIPLKMSYHKNRFCFSAGNNFGLYHFNKEVIYYENDFNRTFHTNGLLAALTHFETISYQLFKNKYFFIDLSAEQSYDFYKISGYNNWFMIGGTYLF